MAAHPCFFAAMNGHLDVVRLLSEGGEIDQATRDGRSPLFIAAQQGHLEVVRFLLQAGADKHRATAKGSTPVTVAARHGHAEVTALLSEPEAGEKTDEAPVPTSPRVFVDSPGGPVAASAPDWFQGILREIGTCLRR